MDAGQILFVAQSVDASCYHRIMLPANALGCAWCRLDGSEPDLAGYRIVVVQTPVHDVWLELIPKLQAGGTRVLFEVDYDLHAIEQPPDALAGIEAAVRMCDGVICATERIAERYAAFNPHTHVCESGVDLYAYALTRPRHDTVNIGWAGRSLLVDEMRPWLAQVADVMRARDVTNFISIGQPYADVLAGMGVVAPERCLAIPLLLPEQLPAAMSIFDIGFDPMGTQPWRRSRSQLRWLEAGAWGIPFAGDRRIYPRIEHGRTGVHASDPQTMGRELLRLVDDAELRAAIGAEARRTVAESYSIEAVAAQWVQAFERVAG
jgi:glycosyltransferase involved in cell wall biosynthesis